MKLSYSLLLAILTLGIALSTSTESMAFGGPPGGPYSNGSYFPNDGTFSAVVRGENLIGTLQFSTTGDAGPVPSSTSTSGNSTTTTTGSGGVGSTGIATIYFNGDTFRGNSQGSLNAMSSSMAINFQVDSESSGLQVYDINQIVDLGETTQETTTVNPDGTSVTVVTTTPNRQIAPVSQVQYFSSWFLSGALDCKTSNSFPNQKFNGTGVAQVQFLQFADGITGGEAPTLMTEDLPISVTGVRLSNVASAFQVSEVRAPWVGQVTVLRNAN